MYIWIWPARRFLLERRLQKFYHFWAISWSIACFGNLPSWVWSRHRALGLDSQIPAVCVRCFLCRMALRSTMSVGLWNSSNPCSILRFWWRTPASWSWIDPEKSRSAKKTALIWPMILSHHSVSTCQMTKDEKDQSRSLWKHHHRGCLRLYKAISTAVFRGGQGFKMSPVTRPLCSRQTGPTRPKR